MHILHFDLDDLENPLAGGQCVRTYEINRRLAKKGHDITVITSKYKGSRNLTKNGIKYVRVGFSNGPLRYISYFLIIPYLIFKHRPDLIIEDTIPPFTFGFSQIYTKIPVIASVQSFHASYASKVHHFPFWILEKYGAKTYKNFIVLTDNMKNKLAKLNKKAKIAVIPNGINGVPSFSRTHKNYLLYLGRIDYYEKGLDLLVNSMKIIKNQLPGLKLKIAGDGKDREFLVNLLKKEKLDNVEYIGKINGSLKEKTLSECFLLIQPSRLETFGLTILEAAAYGKPCVCYYIDNFEYVSNKTIGLQVEKFNSNKFADAIIKLISSEKTYANLSKNAYKWAATHRWDNIATDQENFYRSVLNSKSKQ